MPIRERRLVEHRCLLSSRALARGGSRCAGPEASLGRLLPYGQMQNVECRVQPLKPQVQSDPKLRSAPRGRHTPPLPRTPPPRRTSSTSAARRRMRPLPAECRAPNAYVLSRNLCPPYRLRRSFRRSCCNSGSGGLHQISDPPLERSQCSDLQGEMV